MRIQHNILAMNAYRNYNTNTSALAKNLEKLSSGYKINRAGDDAAGLAISEKMRAQITGLNAAQKNVKDGISLVKTAEGAMQEIQDMLNRMDYLATQSANGTYDNEVDRLNLQKEVDALKSEINRIADSANFNGIKLLDGSLGSTSISSVGSLVNDAMIDGVTATPGGKAQVTVTLDPAKVISTSVDASSDDTETFDGVDPTAATADTYKVTVADVAGANQTEIGDGAGTQITLNGTTDVDTLLTATDAGGALLSDKYDITVTDKDGNALTGTDAIDTGAIITFTAKQTGKLADSIMNAITYSTGAASEVRDGWDEGTDGAGNNTHYELAINTGKLVGGASFSFGTGSKTSTFDITYDDVETDNGTITNPDAGTEVGADRTKINLSKTMTDREIADAIKKVVGDKMTDFNVKVEVNGSNIKLSMDAKKATEDTNLGGVRYSSQTGAFGGGVYKAYNAFDGGTPGTYAQVSYEFNLSNLKSGDSLTIGDTTIKVGEKTATEKSPDGSYKVTLSEEDAQNADTLIKAFESAGYQSGQLKIENGRLTITGTEAGQKAADLAKAGGKVGLTSTRTLVSGGLTLQIGDTSDDFNQMTVAVGDMHTTGMGIDGVDISNQTGAKDAIQTIKNAINYVSGVRGDLGATQNRLEHTANNLSVMAENIQDAESTIRDTDIAEEMMAYTKNNILIQSAQAMLAQANAVPQGVLQLLG